MSVARIDPMSRGLNVLRKSAAAPRYRCVVCGGWRWMRVIDTGRIVRCSACNGDDPQAPIIVEMRRAA